MDAFWVRGGCRLEGEGLTRKYVDIGAGPEWEIWNGMRLGEHSGRSRVTGDISMLVVLGGRERAQTFGNSKNRVNGHVMSLLSRTNYNSF